MKPLVAEWIAKAEADFATLEREARVRKNPNYDGICFHAQQCAEKYLKARLCAAGLPIQKIHDLVRLLDQNLPLEPLWETYRFDLAHLTDYAVEFRYPGDTATRETAMQARKLCRSFRSAARAALGLPAK